MNGVKTSYKLDGDRIASQTNGTDTISYTYDSNGKPYSMNLNGTIYYYELNLQGDVIGLIDSNNNVVVNYTYDSWGNLQSIGGSLAGTLGKKNPLRYRGYYYDTETGMYYLQSRYYNPEIGRFISRDDAQYHEGNTGIKANLYAYCDNNPVMNVDPDGHLAAQIISGLICGAISAIFDFIGRAMLYYFTHRRSLNRFRANWWSISWAFASGFITGAFMMTKIKKLGQALIGGITTAVTGIISSKRFNPKSVLIDFIIGAICGYFGGNGVGTDFFRGAINFRGGYYYIGRVAYRHLPFANMAVLRSFATALVKYLVGPLISSIKAYA